MQSQETVKFEVLIKENYCIFSQLGHYMTDLFWYYIHEHQNDLCLRFALSALFSRWL